MLLMLMLILMPPTSYLCIQRLPFMQRLYAAMYNGSLHKLYMQDCKLNNAVGRQHLVLWTKSLNRNLCDMSNVTL